MGETVEIFKLMKEHKQKKHAEWKHQNLEFLTAKMPYRWESRNNNETIMFREAGYPKVDFYPSTGRWRIPGQKNTFRGGAESFFNWYKKQKGGE